MRYTGYNQQGMRKVDAQKEILIPGFRDLIEFKAIYSRHSRRAVSSGISVNGVAWFSGMPAARREDNGVLKFP